MKARQVSRELALFSLSQLSKHVDDLDNDIINKLIISAVRTLNEYAMKNIRGTIPDLYAVKEYLEQLELNDPQNLNSPIDADMQPVNLPKTDTLKKHINSMFDAIEYTLHCVELNEVTALSKKDDVKDYSVELIKQFAKNREDIDQLINKNSEGWQIDRFLKIDKNILRLAVTEMAYMDHVPNVVSINEAIELTKKYSSEESSKFVNGILGHVNAELKNIEIPEKESV